MARRVPVELTLQAQQYLSEARKVETQTAAVDEIIRALGHEVDETGRDMDKLAAETAVAKKEVGDLGDKSRAAAADLALLDRRIAATQRSVKNLGIEFALTGNTVAGERLGRQQSFLTKLQELRKELENPIASGGPTRTLDDLVKSATGGQSNRSMIEDLLATGTKAGIGFAENFDDAVSKKLAGGGTPWAPILIGAAVGAVVLALPEIGAAIAGAVTGIAGIGGIAGGIFAATKDPSVMSAAHEFGSRISAEFFGSGSSFVDPIRESLGILALDFKRLDLAGTFSKVAPYVTTLAAGIGAFALKFMPGFNEALKRAGPYIDAIAEGLGEMGASLGDFLNNVSRSHGSLEGLRFLFGAINSTIVGTGNLLHWLSDRFHDFNKSMAWVFGAIGSLKGFAISGWFQEQANRINNFADHDAPHAAVSGQLLGDSYANVAEKAAIAAEKIKELNRATEENVQANLSLWQANIDAAQAISDLSEKLIAGRDNWDLSTQAGRDNQRQLEQTIEALDRQRQAAIATSDGSVDAINAINAAYDKQLEKILGIAKQAGDTKTALEGLEKTYYVKIVVDYQVLNQQNKAKAVDQSLFNLTGERADGGPVVAGGTYKVGERGEEIVTFNQDGYVYSASQSAAMAREASSPMPWRGSAGAQQVELVVSAAPGGDRSLMGAITQNLRFDIRTSSGGSVQSHLGSGR